MRNCTKNWDQPKLTRQHQGALGSLLASYWYCQGVVHSVLLPLSLPQILPNPSSNTTFHIGKPISSQLRKRRPQKAWFASVILSGRLLNETKQEGDEENTAIRRGCVHTMLQNPPRPSAIISSSRYCGTYSPLSFHPSSELQDPGP
jgi:hypothetical protein